MAAVAWRRRFPWWRLLVGGGFGGSGLHGGGMDGGSMMAVVSRGGFSWREFSRGFHDRDFGRRFAFGSGARLRVNDPYYYDDYSDGYGTVIVGLFIRSLSDSR